MDISSELQLMVRVEILFNYLSILFTDSFLEKTKPRSKMKNK